MPRKRRIHYQEAMYHVMLRGNYRQNIFLSDQDYEYFSNQLNKITKTYACKIHLYCLMTNHIHLVIEVRRVPLSKIIHAVTSPYARFINQKIQKTGHLFQGRYKAKLIQNEEYLLELCHYIHLNPLKANLVKHIDEYPWSSHLVYSKRKEVPWVSTEYVFNLLKKHAKTNPSHAYENFINDRKNHYINPEFFELDKDGNLIITDSVNAKINNKERLELNQVSITKIAEIICDSMQVSLETLMSESRKEKDTLARSMVTYFAHYYGQYPLNEIAALLFREPDTLSKTMHRHLASENKKRLINRWIIRLEQQFSKFLRS